MATNYLEQQLGLFPQHAAVINKMHDLHDKKLWHQLTDVVENEFLKSADVRSQFNLIQFYQSFVADFASRMNQITFVRIAVEISKQLPDIPKRIEFLQKVAEQKKVIDETAAHVLIRCTIAELHVLNKNLPEAKTILDQCSTTVNESETLDTVILAGYHRAWCFYYKLKDAPQEFYRSGLQYLAFTSIASIPQEERVSLAFDMCIAALIGEDIYNFGELMGHEITGSLQGTGLNWVRDIISAFSNGNLAGWKQLQVQYAGNLNQQPALVASKVLLEQKISILSLIEEMFNKSTKQITFDQISQVTQLPKQEVEWLIMRALSLGLIRGSIDQVQEKVTISWVQPRTLSREQIGKMKERMTSWSSSVKDALLLMEDQITPEMI